MSKMLKRQRERRERQLATYKAQLEAALKRYRREKGDPQQAMPYLMQYVHVMREEHRADLEAFAIQLCCREYSEELK